MHLVRNAAIAVGIFAAGFATALTVSSPPRSPSQALLMSEVKAACPSGGLYDQGLANAEVRIRTIADELRGKQTLPQAINKLLRGNQQ